MKNRQRIAACCKAAEFDFPSRSRYRLNDRGRIASAIREMLRIASEARLDEAPVIADAGDVHAKRRDWGSRAEQRQDKNERKETPHLRQDYQRFIALTMAPAALA